MSRFLARFVRPRGAVRRVLAAVVILAGLASCSGATGRPGPGDPFSREAILAIISEESPVYYRDGETRIGVFFAREHRVYVPWAEIPRACVDAIVAAEDSRFWQHGGVDPEGILRAAWINLKAGSLVAGGSTITQQTAKNLFYRPDRSFRSKWEEMQNAMRLEELFSKEEILEFYVNQFHVSGNGRGIGIAARYFFDKEAADLDLHECAFMAGMVKAPARYNPWIGRTDEDQQAARERARQRTAYVLRRMAETGVATEATRRELEVRPVPFKRGHFSWERSVLLDLVEDRLARAPFPAVLAQAGIENASTAGLRIVTTLDRRAQEAATYGLVHHLTELGGFLDGENATDVLLPTARAPRVPLAATPRVRTLLDALVIGTEGEGNRRVLVLDLGGAPVRAGRGADPEDVAIRPEAGHLRCRVDRDGLQRLADVLVRSARKEPRARAGDSDVDALLEALPAGSVVRASVRSIEAERATCDVEIRARLQGAVVALEGGRVRALVGGSDNRDFNRAVSATRQFGSTWKPLVYWAALQLGWLPTDEVDNRRGVFPFEGTWYYPRPDHEGPPRVSLAWAGARSENLASIWLLFHLVDRLDEERFRTLAGRLDLAPRADEPREAWVRRIRDVHGVLPLESRLEETAFEAARARVLAALDARAADVLEVRSLHYGRGFDAERERVRTTRSGALEHAQIAALSHDFLRLDALAASCRRQAEALGQALAADRYPDRASVGSLAWRSADRTLGCYPGTPPEGMVALDDPEASTGAMEEMAGALPRTGDLLVDGLLHLSTLDALRAAQDAEVRRLGTLDPWDWESISWNPDFRRTVALRYVAWLARAAGVDRTFPPVLSLPLGAVDVSLLEIATLYQAMLDGTTPRFPGTAFHEGTVPGLRTSHLLAAAPESWEIIEEIRDRDGNLVYRAEREAVPIVDPEPGRMVTDILENVVQFGTGQRARSAVAVRGVTWPLLGKTGTTNEYRNAAFVGFVPVARDGRPSLEGGLTLAAYVGYDDNTPMRRGGLRVAGASGALPAWILAVRGMAESGLLEEAGRVVEAGEPVPEGDLVRVAVDLSTGLPTDAVPEVPEGADATVLPLVLTLPPGRERLFAPFRFPPDAAPVAPSAPPASPPLPDEPTEEEILPPEGVEPEGPEASPPPEDPPAPAG